MRSGGLTERYVKALTGMPLPKGLTPERLAEELAAFAEMYTERRELREVLENPAFSENERRGVVDQLAANLKVSAVAKNMLLVLIDNRRTRLLPDIARGLGRHLDAQSGIARARVAAANPLSSAQVDRLTEVLTQIHGRPVRIETEVEPALVGGVRVEVEGQVYDGSIRTRIASLRDAILKEAP